MPVYIYRCSNGHEVQVVHPMKDNAIMICSECREEMQRRPQLFQWYMSPFYTALDIMDDRYRKSRKRSRT